MSKKDFIVGALQPNGDIDAEATVGVFSPPVASASPDMSRETLDYEETLGNRFPTASEYGGRIFEGDVEGAARPNSFPFFLSMIFGPPTTEEILAPDGVGNLPGVFRHTWLPAALDMRPLPASLWVARQDPATPILDKFVGAKGNTMAMNVEANGYLTYTVGMAIKRIIENAAVPSVARDTTRKWSFTRVALEIAAGVGRNDDVNLEPIPVTSYGMTYGNNLATDQYQLGSSEVDDFPEGNVEPEVTFTPLRDLHVHYRRALAETPEDVRLKLTATGPIIREANTYEMSVDMKRIQYTTAPAAINAGETLRNIAVTARPVFDDAFGDLMSVSVVNDQNGDTYRAPVV